MIISNKIRKRFFIDTSTELNPDMYIADFQSSINFEDRISLNCIVNWAESNDCIKRKLDLLFLRGKYIRSAITYSKLEIFSILISRYI